MLRRLTSTVIQTRGIKHTVKITWVRPEYVPAYKPEKSGDLESVPKVPPTAIANDFAESEELKDASDTVKKLFSIAHRGKREYNILVKKELMNRVRRHDYDENTAETRIARITGQIRCLQETLNEFPKHVGAKKTAQELIDKRRKLLKFLREYDYKKFEWLIEKLNIRYMGSPSTLHKLSRKESLRKLTELHCDDIREKKLMDYRNLLESQQGPFLKSKLETLRFIKSEQEELQLPITVTDQDIKKVEDMLKEWTIKDDIKQQAKKKKRNLLLETD